jgi:defect-in-organelle-trafficking protein DotC
LKNPLKNFRRKPLKKSPLKLFRQIGSDDGAIRHIERAKGEVTSPAAESFPGRKRPFFPKALATAALAFLIFTVSPLPDPLAVFFENDPVFEKDSSGNAAGGNDSSGNATGGAAPDRSVSGGSFFAQAVAYGSLNEEKEISPKKAKVKSQKELELLLNAKFQKDPGENLKNRSINEAAYKIALETGARARYSEILESLEPFAPALDEIFDFTPLVTPIGRLILEPPVATALTEVVSAKGLYAAKDQGLTYRLIRTGRFLSQVPHWRGYLTPPLYESLPEPDDAHVSLRPSDAKEREVWRKAILEGWKDGRERADRLFDDALAVLSRDFLGLCLFWELNAKGYVIGPTVESVSVPFQSSEREMLWDETHYAIKEPGRFKGQSDKPPKNKGKSGKKPGQSPLKGEKSQSQAKGLRP